MVELLPYIESDCGLQRGGEVHLPCRKGVRWVQLFCMLLFAFSVTSLAQTGSVPPNDSDEDRYPSAISKQTGMGAIDMPPAGTPAFDAVVSSKDGVVDSGKSKDLSVFFAIGFIVNILVIGAFVYWAVGQWRKTK